MTGKIEIHEGKLPHALMSRLCNNLGGKDLGKLTATGYHERENEWKSSMYEGLFDKYTDFPQKSYDKAYKHAKKNAIDELARVAEQKFEDHGENSTLLLVIEEIIRKDKPEEIGNPEDYFMFMRYGWQIGDAYCPSSFVKIEARIYRVEEQESLNEQGI